MSVKRYSRKAALGFWFCCDQGDIEWYQQTRAGKVPVMATDDFYYCAVRENEKPPAVGTYSPYDWEKLGDAYGYSIMKARVQKIDDAS